MVVGFAPEGMHVRMFQLHSVANVKAVLPVSICDFYDAKTLWFIFDNSTFTGFKNFKVEMYLFQAILLDEIKNL